MPGAAGVPYGPDEFVVEASGCSLNAFPPTALFGRCEPGKVKGVSRVLPPNHSDEVSTRVGRNDRRNLLQDTWCAGRFTLLAES